MSASEPWPVLGPHVRRGDYVKQTEIFPPCGMDQFLDLRRPDHAMACSPLAFTRLSSLRDGPSGRFSPRSHLLTASLRTLR